MTTVGLPILSIVALVGLLVASAFFSSTEIAVFSLSRAWLDERVAAKDPRASILAELREDPHRLLVTLLVGNNVVNVAISSILAVLLAERFTGEIAVLLTTVVASSVVLVFGEILPKAYGLGNAEDWALTTARPVWVVERLLLPVVVVFDFVTRRAGSVMGGDPDIEEPYTDTAGEGAK
ncbi:CNNM domain-containing protein [Haloplanus sp. C73]|uniref:CNNM domain-containing protein n=1 Tax=Haloplanus sp. C73 TaxID=3421641 RepID=UPI003EBFF245